MNNSANADFIGYGICRLAVIPVRSAPSEPSEMVTQLLFGEHYGVLEVSENSKWIKIENHFDGYQGWIDLLQHHPIDAPYYQEINQSDYLITCDLTGVLSLGKQILNLVAGSIVPQSDQELFANDTLHYAGTTKPQSQRWNFNDIKILLTKYLGSPYLWGGKSPWGIDCSGLVQQVYRIAGFKLPRDARQQILKGVEVPYSALLPGDLAFFISEDNKVNHVGIILEEYQIIHASGKVRIDKLDQQGITRNQSITHKLYAIRRIMP